MFMRGCFVRQSTSYALSALLLGFGYSGIANACSSCGCSLNSDWASQGYTVSSGWSLDLKDNYFDQSQLRRGTRSVDRSSVAIPAEEEIQQHTINRELLLAVDYSPSREWGFNVQVPYFDRPHSTITAGETEISESHSRGLGDVRVMARYQGFSPDLSWGVQFGLKLPTGRSDDVFMSGPEAGNIVDRGLQLGTGTTDLLLGVYNFGNLNDSFDYFAHALVQAPLDSHDEFKPGAGLTLSVGLRYRTKTDTFVPHLQVNVRTEKRESGANADNANSGATLAYLSPGASFRITDKLNGFAFVQVPVYQRVNGLQLEPRGLGTVGVRYRF
jgi:hypothetical protein